MPIHVQCSCGQAYTASDGAAGRILICQKCRGQIQVPFFDQNGATHGPESYEFREIPWFYAFAKFVCYAGIVLGTIANLSFSAMAAVAVRRQGDAAFIPILFSFLVIQALILFSPCLLLILVDIGEVLRKRRR